MAKLSMREAAKHFDVSRPTLQKALKSGKISGVQDGQGHNDDGAYELLGAFVTVTELTAQEIQKRSKAKAKGSA